MARVYTDFNGLNNLKSLGRENSTEGLRAVSKQFEAMFLQMMLKSMREASFGDPLMGSSEMDTYHDLYDKQISIDLAEAGQVGLADMMFKQMSQLYDKQLPGEKTDNSKTSVELKTVWDYAREKGIPSSATHQKPIIKLVKNEPDNFSLDSARDRLSQPLPTTLNSPQNIFELFAIDDEPFLGPEDFINKLSPMARWAANQIGLEPNVLLAQAALETGWGKHMIKDGNLGNSFNLFGIKADSRWLGDAVTVSTHEFTNGRSRRQHAPFRAYQSYAESFTDYIRFIKTQERYEKAIEKASNAKGYLQELQKAGYATDPDYADKIMSIIGRNKVLFHTAKPDLVAVDQLANKTNIG